MSYRGKFHPKNKHKYAGDFTKITYRSSLELNFMKYCDRSSNIISWSSEEVIIPYRSPLDNAMHRYFPDFLIKKRDGTEVLIEVKPSSQTKPPVKKQMNVFETVKKKRRYVTSVQTWLVNEAKWKFAIAVCKKKGWSFQLLTEKELSSTGEKY